MGRTSHREEATLPVPCVVSQKISANPVALRERGRKRASKTNHASWRESS